MSRKSFGLIQEGGVYIPKLKHWVLTPKLDKFGVYFSYMPTDQANPKTLFYIVFVIGFIFAIVMVILFFNAAPARSNIEEHRKSNEAADCLKCHLKGDEESPTMPHLNLGRCNLCHGLAKETL